MQRPLSSLNSTASISLTLDGLIATRHQTLRNVISRQQALDLFPGQRTGPRRGQGLEFEDLRPYTHGDDIRHIDWNVTARTGEPYTRLYREEREHSTTVYVDLRPSMFTGSRELRAVRAGRLAATILWQANQSGDRCSVVTCTNNGLSATRPQSGYRGVVSACELIHREFNTSSGQTDQPERDLTPVLEWINRPGRSRGTNIVLSGFDSLGESHWDTLLKTTGILRRTIAVMLLDPLEVNAIPPGRYPYRSRKGPRSISISENNLQDLQILLSQEISSVLHTFNRSGVPVIQLDPAASGSNLIRELFNQAAL